MSRLLKTIAIGFAITLLITFVWSIVRPVPPLGLRRKTTIRQLEEIVSRVNAYQQDHRKVPSSLEELEGLDSESFRLIRLRTKESGWIITSWIVLAEEHLFYRSNGRRCAHYLAIDMKGRIHEIPVVPRRVNPDDGSNGPVDPNGYRCSAVEACNCRLPLPSSGLPLRD